MSNKNKVIKNILWLFTEHGIRLAATLISASILAKVLGVEAYGIYQYLIGLIAVFSSLSYICASEVVVPKLTIADGATRKSVMGNGFFIRLFFSIIAYILFIGFVFITESERVFNLALILGLPIIFNESCGIVTAYLQSQTIIRYRVIIMMISLTLRTLVFIVLYLMDVREIIIYAIVLSFEAAFLAGGLLWVYSHLTKEYFYTFEMRVSIELIKQGIPFFSGLVLMFIFVRLDLILLRHLSDAASLGLYASSLQLFNALTAIAPMIAMSYAPLYVYRYDNSFIIKRNVLLGAILLGLIAILFSFAIYHLSYFLIEIVFGKSFSGAASVFKYLIWVSPLFFINEGLNIYIIKMQLGRMLIYKWCFVLLFACIAYMLYIPRFGALGAVFGLGSAYFLSCLFGLYILLRKNTSMKEYRNL